jgi:RpiB/LacA/LacB family sugar-phosphate isomerase
MTIPTRTIAGREVGAIGLGCMGMSWAYGAAHRDDEESVRVIHRALELGVTLIDTSDAYGPFTNEELVGRALADRRDQAYLATKGGLIGELVKGRPQITRNGRPEHLREAIDASLRRLQTDHIDLYQLHRTDPDVPVEESWGAMAEAVQAGRARYGVLVCGTGIGISIAANRLPGIRCALVHDATGARLSREHNDANVIAFGARMTGAEPALEALRAFLATPYAGGRHDRRVLKLSPDWTRTP